MHHYYTYTYTLIPIHCSHLNSLIRTLLRSHQKLEAPYLFPSNYVILYVFCPDVIHTVGPQDGSDMDLRSCYEKSLQLCIEHDIHSVAFPCISTGVYGNFGILFFYQGCREFFAFIVFKAAFTYFDWYPNKTYFPSFFLRQPSNWCLLKTALHYFICIKEGAAVSFARSKVVTSFLLKK